ncbi:MAG: cytochrome P450 [Acidimicrobiales bacterium]|nr:MAG: cytochrome P450 [Acidimicrobiales bacterium]
MVKLKDRPKPRFEDDRFIAAVPVPDQREVDDYRWYDGFSTIAAIANNPLESFNAAQYRDPYTQYKMFGTDFCVINCPELIHHCFVANRHNYKFSAIRQRILRAVIGDGLISAEGEKWQHARRAMSPMFTPRNVKVFAEMMKQTTLREMPAVLEAAADNNGELEIANPMAALTYLVLSDTLFSGDIDRGKNEILRDVSTALLYVGRPDPLDFMGAPDWVPRLTRLRGLKAVKNLREMIAELTRIRKTERDRGDNLPDDFLTRLLQVGDDDTRSFSDLEVEEHLLAFIGAGHETTARALSWLFYLLSNDTNARDRLEAEVDALDIDAVPPEQWGDQLPFALVP